MLAVVIFNFSNRKWSSGKKNVISMGYRRSWLLGRQLSFHRGLNTLDLQILTLPLRHKTCGWGEITLIPVERWAKYE